ncbi:MAG: TolC family protein [Phycisphaerales bacterium]|nr:TolC family protein [Planctomycetota bacterium]MBL6997812.1 TolC family protein [Phycisphaerales bacterium]
MNFKLSGSVCFLALVFFIVGCQSYEPSPLDIGSYRNSLETRLIDIEPVSSFANRLSVDNNAPDKFSIIDGITSSEGEVIALFYNPELRIARLKAGVALTQFETAGLWQDPVFGFDGAEISSPSAPFQFGVMGTLTIPISGRLKVEKSRAGTEYEAQLRELVDAEWNLRAELRSGWAHWTAASMQVELINDVIEQLDRINQIANTLIEAGEINRVEHRLLQVELANNEVEATEATLTLLQAEIELLKLMGLPPDSAKLLIQEFPSVELVTVEDETARLIDANTELAILFAKYQTAEETLRLEIKKQYPDIVIGSGYGSEFNDHRVLFGLSIPLSIWNRNQAGIANARTLREVARAEAETTFARLFRELALANTTLLVKQTQHSYFEDEIVPMLQEQTRDIEKIVELGEVDTFILLETVTRQHEAKRRLLELQVAELDAAITVHRILGPEYQMNPSPINREITTKDTLGGVQ